MKKFFVIIFFGAVLIMSLQPFNRDEGDWRYGIEGTRGSRRVYDDEDATEILRWLQAHRAEARRTADPRVMVLSD